MSDLSEAIARANKRLDAMTQVQREKRYHIILREELQRIASGTLTEGGDAKQAPGESLSGPVANGETPTTPRP